MPRQRQGLFDTFARIVSMYFIVTILAYYTVDVKNYAIIIIMPRVSKYELPALEATIEPIGKKIARLRKKKGLTQKQLADKIGIGQTLITDYERGKIRLYDEMIIRFALALNVSTDDILGFSKSEIKKDNVSLRLMKRVLKIEALPEATKKAIIKTIDDLIKANT